MSLVLLLFMACGVLLAGFLIRHGDSLLDLLPRRKRPLKCLRPYVPLPSRTGDDDFQSTRSDA